MVPKPYLKPDIRSAHFIPASSPACLEAKKAQTMWLPFRKRLPPPSSHPGDPKPHGEHRCFPIHFTGPPFPNGPGSPYPRPTGHTGGVQKGKIRHELAVYLPLSSRIEQHGVILCLRRVIGCFLPRERDVTLRRLRKQQLHYRGGIIRLQTPLLHCESEWIKRWHDNGIILSAHSRWCEIEWPLMCLVLLC